MPRNVQFLLDTPLVDEDYIVTGGNTEPSIIDGLLGNITFKPWTGFRRIIEDANAVVERLSNAEIEEAKLSLDKARRFIETKRRSHMMSLKTEEQRKALYETKTAKRSTNNTGTSDSGLFDNAKSKIDESANKKPRIEPWRVRKPVTSSLSIAELHTHVISALQELLRVMYPAENLGMEERLISSENVMAEASEKMIHNYMRGLIEKVKKQQVDRDDFHTEKRSGESSTGNEDDFGTEGRELVEGEEVQPLRRSPRIQEKRKNEKKGLSLLDREEDISDLIPKKPVIALNQTPDRCLFRVSLSDPGEIPVCCYEFKGPTLDLTGLVSWKEVLDSSTADGTISQIVSHGNTTTRDGQYQSMAGYSDSDIGGTVSIAEGEEDLYIPGLSAPAIAGQYNTLFDDANKSTANNANRKLVLLPVAQVICQALLSRTGCVFLTNHQTAFALRVEEDAVEGSDGVTVFVTGAIPCNKEPGQFSAMLGFTKYCVDTLINAENEDELLNPKRRLLMSLSYAAYNVDKAIEPLDKDWCPGDEPGGHAEGDRSQQGARSSQRARYEHCEDGESSAADVSTLGLSSFENSASTADQEDGAALEGGNIGNMRKPFRSNMDERLKTMFSATEGLLTVGASGILIRGTWDGTKVAIKIWNGQSREGFLSIRREIKVFRRLQIKCPSVLGSAVPRFLLGWDNPQEYSVYRKQLILLTQLVGDGIKGSRNGNLWIQNGETLELVTSGDRRMICKAALSSLEELHRNGFIHGDIALRNMRVMKTPQFELGWKVWWLDLGRGLEMKDNASPMYFEHERRICLALFGLSKLEGTFGTETPPRASRYGRSDVDVDINSIRSVGVL